jgi:class 3 adenylate cyclase
LKAAQIPIGESARLQALRDYQILDTAPESQFDDLTRLASFICGTPMATVSLIDAERQWFKSRIGFEPSETAREIAFCAHAINQPEDVFVVADAAADERFADNPLVTSAPNIRFYAGAPLVTPDGQAIGTICVLDREPRQLSREQLDAMRALGRQTIAQMELRLSLQKLAQERQKSEELLANILPAAIIEQLKHQPGLIAERFSAATVLFADLVGFTELAAAMQPVQVLHLLNDIFSRFDRLSEQYGLEKIKTIGDAYMAVAGVPQAMPSHAAAAAGMALAMLQEIQAVNQASGHALSLRIGLHSGPLVAGVIGTRKFSYDLWGDTVNTASRMESHGLPGAIQISAACEQLLRGHYAVSERGVIAVKGKGEMLAYWLQGKK